MSSPACKLTAVASWQPDASPREGERQGGYDVVIFDRVAAPELTEGNVILINTVAPNLPLARAGRGAQRRE